VNQPPGGELVADTLPPQPQRPVENSLMLINSPESCSPAGTVPASFRSYPAR
jgi:hypothetical protein